MNRMVDLAGDPTWVDDRGAGDETVVLLHGGMSHSRPSSTRSGKR